MIHKIAASLADTLSQIRDDATQLERA